MITILYYKHIVIFLRTVFMQTINIEAEPGEIINEFTQRMIDTVKSAKDKNYTLVIGIFNGIEIKANVYSHKRLLIDRYHALLMEQQS